MSGLLTLAAESAGPALDALPAPAGSPVDWAWLIPVIPGLSAALLLVFGKRLGRASAAIAITAVGASATISTAVFAFLLAQPAEERVYERVLATWIDAGSFTVDWALLIDPLATVMLLLITWVGLLIHIYSLGYMHGDERYHHFFAYLNLFVFSMLVLVTGSSFLTTFVGWELVGLCSYLLIGFWFTDRYNAGAAKKAFVVNRVGDVGFMIAMFLVFGAFGTLNYTAVLTAPEALAGGTAVAVGLLLLLGATGKSAQIPLYVWLPDAMAGPTPVSALIHAATMVTAGVYLIARTSPIWALIPDIGLLVAWVGVVTALLAAVIACAQNDYKRILAYSTVSQLGYMFVAVGMGDYTAGVFHLLTHGFFKALLFLAAGSVMHALHDELNIWNTGGLWRAMPFTAATSGVAVLAISGIPPLSGFFSKEEVLAAAAGTPGGLPIYVLGLITAGLTAFYMTRWFVLLFLGEPRYDAHLHPHEPDLSMTMVLGVLAVLSALGGLINITPETGFLHGWLEPSLVPFEAEVEAIPNFAGIAAAVLAGIAGIAGALALYLRRGVDPQVEERPVGLRRVAFDRFYVDEVYSLVIVRIGAALATALAAFDRFGIDGAVNGAASFTGGLATSGRRLQTGFVRNYALAVLFGAVLVIGLFAGVVV